MNTMLVIPIIDCSGSMQGIRECDADMVSAFTGSPEAVNSVTYDEAGFMDVSSLKFGKLFADRCRAYLRKLLPQ